MKLDADEAAAVTAWRDNLLADVKLTRERLERGDYAHRSAAKRAGKMKWMQTAFRRAAILDRVLRETERA